VFTRLNIDVVAPIPSASVSNVTVVKPKFFLNCRNANRKSLISECIESFSCQSSEEECNHGTKVDYHVTSANSAT
jgi:hypothetical protein